MLYMWQQILRSCNDTGYKNPGDNTGDKGEIR